MRIRHDGHAAPRIVPSVPEDRSRTLVARLRPVQRRGEEGGATSGALP
ncbi:transcriptional regulator, partial [Burkholderia pseudomallei]